MASPAVTPGAARGKHEFDAVIEATGGGAFVSVPFDVEAVFGKKRVKVNATFDGEPYRGSVVRMGGEDHMLIVVKAIRDKIGKQPGDRVHVTLEEDAAPREVVVPADLRAALDADPEAAAAFDRLSFTHRREYVIWIEEAKREETRRRRIDKAAGMLREGRTAR
jgi:bifunctional DNA-binding transcriptional regulator/antitoxin component of YhaV-PrlF toxin-antitoxin module